MATLSVLAATIKPNAAKVPRKMRALKYSARPICTAFELDEHLGLIEAAHDELEERAVFDRDLCMGYFPAIQGQGESADLPHCRELAESLPHIQISNGLPLGFDWLRLSLKKQPKKAPYHLDLSRGTGMSSVEGAKRITRLLLNFSPDFSRKIGYLVVDPLDAPLKADNGFRIYDGDPPSRAARTLIIPPRQRGMVFGAIIEVTNVLHSGIEEEDGHFLASYSTEANRE